MRGAITAVVLVACLAVLAGATPVLAAPVSVGSVTVRDGYNQGDTLVGGDRGGEFRFWATDPSWIGSMSNQVMDPYRSAPWDYPNPGPDFAAFCVQINEYIYPTGDSLGTYAAAYDTQTDDGHVLNGSVAWLFNAWNNGTLGAGSDNYSYAAGQQRRDDAMQLQRLIWKYMGQIFPATGYNFATYSPTAGTKYALWDQAAGTHLQDSIGSVRILELGPGGTDQGMVMLTNIGGSGQPVPEPGSFALLAIGALGVLPLLRRRTTT